MILIDTLNPPYTEQEKDAFVNKYYCNNNVIKCDVDNIIEVWQYTNEDKYSVLEPKQPEPTPEEKLRIAKEQKYYEALNGAKNFIDNEAFYQFDENNSIEATDGNIGKMTAYALAFQTGTVEEVQWTSKEDNVLILSAEDVLNILLGLGNIQSDVWNIQFVTYKTAIETAQTVEEVEAIEVHYVN